MNIDIVIRSTVFLSCIIIYLIMMYIGICGLKGKNIGLKKHLKLSGIWSRKNTGSEKSFYLCLIVSSILFTVTDILVFNNIGSQQDSQLIMILLVICLIPQCIVTIVFCLQFNNYLTKIIVLGIDDKSMKPLMRYGISWGYSTLVHLAIALGLFLNYQMN